MTNSRITTSYFPGCSKVSKDQGFSRTFKAWKFKALNSSTFQHFPWFVQTTNPEIITVTVYFCFFFFCQQCLIILTLAYLLANHHHHHHHHDPRISSRRKSWTKLQGCCVSRTTLMSLLLRPIVCVAVWSAKQIELLSDRGLRKEGG